MNKLISIVGASGTGKTSLTQVLAHTHKFKTAYEQHQERPFQALFKADKKYALANQIDYFLLRATQEQELRAAAQIGLMDGGLDLDFHGFTRLFLHRNLLAEPEFDLCRKLYNFIRETLPPPELIVRLNADVETVTSRMVGRQRINIANAKDTALFNSLLDEWLESLPSTNILTLNVTHESMEYVNSINLILAYMQNHF